MRVRTTPQPGKTGILWVEHNEVLRVIEVTVQAVQDRTGPRIEITIARDDDTVPVDIHLP